MCNRSFSADSYDWSWPGGSRSQMIRQAYTVGPATSLFIEQLWNRASQEAYWQSLKVFEIARWYSPHRVERAITRLLDARAAELDALRFVLVEELDRLSQRPDADLYGQIEFPFFRRRA